MKTRSCLGFCSLAAMAPYVQGNWRTDVSRPYLCSQEWPMPDALADAAKPRMDKRPSALSSIVPAQEAQGAIRRAFPCEGDLRVRYLWSADGVSKFRANWFREEGGKTILVRSLFLSVGRTAEDLTIQDESAVR
jgi:hypothetical protein